MPGGGGNTTTTQKADPWKGIQPYLLGQPGSQPGGQMGGQRTMLPVNTGYDDTLAPWQQSNSRYNPGNAGVSNPGISTPGMSNPAMPGSEGIQGAYPWLYQEATNVPSYYPDQTYAGFTPEQQQSQNMALNYANSMNPGIAMDAMNYGLTSVYNPEANPVLGRYIESAQQPLQRAYDYSVGNVNTNNAVASGGLGGSRQGVADAEAARGYMDASKNLSLGMYNNAYNQGLDQQARMMAMAPQTMNLGLMPSQIYGQVGLQNQQMSQNQINEDMSRYGFDQNAGYNRARDYLNILQGTPWGSSSVTGPDPNASSPMASIGGAGMSGLGTYGLLAANPATAPYAIPAGVLMGGMGLFG